MTKDNNILKIHPDIQIVNKGEFSSFVDDMHMVMGKDKYTKFIVIAMTNQNKVEWLSRNMSIKDRIFALEATKKTIF